MTVATAGRRLAPCNARCGRPGGRQVAHRPCRACSATSRLLACAARGLEPAAVALGRPPAPRVPLAARSARSCGGDGLARLAALGRSPRRGAPPRSPGRGAATSRARPRSGGSGRRRTRSVARVDLPARLRALAVDLDAAALDRLDASARVLTKRAAQSHLSTRTGSPSANGRTPPATLARSGRADRIAAGASTSPCSTTCSAACSGSPTAIVHHANRVRAERRRA